jgi:hypothetical protein
MTVATISIAKQFSETPAGRTREDGPDSGQRFREELLVPMLTDNEVVEVDLDGTLGYGSSFLEEAFGGLIRSAGMTERGLKKKLKIKDSRRFYEQRIWTYIKEAMSH